mmetsp:Transcript_24390/g.34200  ORF Transcript_24390/g.34200 Transcript_24390/m.34200 type:complete len:655 (+) Transcript_24390:120-2084(+)
MSSSRGGNIVNANQFQNRSQTESDHSIEFPSLNGTLSQSIPNFDICIVYNRENGHSTASLLRNTLESLAKVDVILYETETETFDPITVESKIASSACIVVILSLGALKNAEVLFAMSAADYYYKDASQVIMVHDAASCFIPGFQEQPAQFRKYFDNVFPFFKTYAQQAAQEVLRRYDDARKQKRSSTTPLEPLLPSSAVSLGIQEVLDRTPTKQAAPTKRMATRTVTKNGSSTPSLSNSNNATNNTTNNGFATVSTDPPHYFFPSIEPAIPVNNNVNTKPPSTTPSTSLSSTSTVKTTTRRIPTLKSLSRPSEEVTQYSTASTEPRPSGSTSRTTTKFSFPPSTSSSTRTRTSSRTTLTRSSDRTPSSVPVANPSRAPRRTPSSGELPSVGNVGVYPPSNSRTFSEAREDHLDLEALEDAELQLALELSKHESASKPAVPPPNTQDDERLARELQEQWNSERQPTRAIESPTREELSDELYALLLQDSDNAPIHLQPVYPDDNFSSDSETENLPSAYDLFDAPPIPMFPGQAHNPYFNHHHHHSTSFSFGSSTHHHHGGQIDVDNMSYEELLELEERMGKAKSEGATKQQISALPTRKVTKVNPEAKCSVCQCEYELGQQITSLPCFHSYHSECIENWLTRKKTCPECLKEIEF